MVVKSKQKMFMTQKQKNKLALLIALELRFGAKGMTLKNQQELKYLTQEFYKCKLKSNA